MLLNILVKPAWILTENLVHNALGHEVWGLYTAMFALGFLFVVVADLGINSLTTRDLAADPGKLSGILPTLFGLKLLLSLVFPLAMVAVGKWVFGYDSASVYILFLAALSLAAAQIFSFLRANVQAFQRFRLDAFASIADRAGLLCVTAALFAYGIDLESFALARALTTLAACIWLGWQLFRIIGPVIPALNGPTLRQTLQKSMPFALYTIVYTAHDKVDQVMLERLAGEYATGLYVGAYRWMDALGMYLWTILPLFFARFAYLMGSLEAQQRLLRFALVVSALPTLVAGLFMVFHGQALLFLFTRSTAEELQIITACLRPLGIALLMNGLVAPISTLLTATHHERAVNRIALATLGLNVGLNFWLIPSYGAEGSAWATALSYGVLDVAYLLYAALGARIQLPWGALFRLGLIVPAAGVLYSFPSFRNLPWYVATAAVCLVVAALAWGMGLFRYLLQSDAEK